MGSSGLLPDPVECAPPPSVAWVARRGQGLFSPPPWDTVHADGTLGGRFADIAQHRTLTFLRSDLAPLARELEIEDIDLSTVAGPRRRFTQTCALLLYEMRTAEGTPRFAGIRYTSRLSASWECWAIFADRLEGVESLPRPILAVDPDLRAAARHLGLAVEDPPDR